MLRVVIADDEKIQREGILKHISWDSYDMTVVGIAENGVQALELIRQYKPEILITDIKMPYMDGLDLSQKAKEMLPGIKILIISGYDDFEYAHKAVELNANAFILKPINMNKLSDELNKLSAYFSNTKKNELEIENIRKQLEESRPILVDKFMKDLFLGFVKSNSKIISRAEYLKIQIPNKNYYVVIMKTENSTNFDKEEEKQYFFNLIFLKKFNQEIKKMGSNVVMQYKEDEFATLLSVEDYEENQIIDFVESLRITLSDECNVIVTAGISKVKHSIEEVNVGCKEAETALKQKFYFGKGKTICYKDIQYVAEGADDYEDEYKELLSYIQLGNTGEVVVSLEKIFIIISSYKNYNADYIKTFCFALVSDLYKIIYDMGEKMENIFGKEDLVWHKIYKFDTLPDVKQWVVNIASAISHHIFSKRSKKNSNVVDIIIKTVEERYYEQISIDDLASLVYLTPNYICNIFKENMGESIIDYLIKIRMSHAQKLLADTNLKVYEIAEKTGFNSTSYFSVAFKNKFGLSPKEYRDSFC